MSVEIDLVYRGDLRCEAVHGPSGNKLITDAPVDNFGKGESFSPTDLVATGLGACTMTIMGIVAQRSGWDLTGMQAHVVKEMVQTPARRIGRLEVVVTIPDEKARALTPEDRRKLELAALHCPVHHSLHPDVVMDIRFEWGEGGFDPTPVAP